MKSHKDQYIKTDENEVINESCIRWIRKMDECLFVCNKSSGCYNNRDMFKICKINNRESYDKLNKHFETK
jgi:hypothetical protein